MWRNYSNFPYQINRKLNEDYWILHYEFSMLRMCMMYQAQTSLLQDEFVMELISKQFSPFHNFRAGLQLNLFGVEDAPAQQEKARRKKCLRSFVQLLT